MTDFKNSADSIATRKWPNAGLSELIAKIDLLNEEAWNLRDLEREKSKKVAEDAYQLAHADIDGEEAYPVGVGKSLTVLSFLNFRAQHLAEALRQAHEAERIFLAAQHQVWLSRTYNNIGICYDSMGESERAIEYLLKQMNQSQKVGDREMEGGAYHDLAFVYHELGQTNEAKRLFEDSLEIFREIDDYVGIVLALDHLARISREEGSFEKAVSLATQAQDSCIQYAVHEFYSSSCIVLAEALLALGRTEDARAELEKGIKHTETFSADRHCVFEHMGKWHLNYGCTKEAIAYLQEALALSQQTEVQDRLPSIYDLLSQCFHKNGEHERAYQYLLEFQKRQAATFEQERKQRTLNLAILHQTETARKEAALAQLENSILEQEIEERKQIEAALRKAQSEAEAASRAKGEFLANMSHEIRTPMNGVIGMVSLLRETELDEEQQSFVDTIQRSGAHLLDVINEILDFSKMESGHLQLDKTAFDLRQCLDDIFGLLQHRAEEKNLTLSYHLAPDVPQYVATDVMRLRQILVNLLGNAIKFTLEGRIDLFVDATPGEDNHSHLHFAIKDTGIGIPQEKQADLFQPFSQADATTTRRYGGTGLGLAISKRLAEALGGGLWCESQQNQGSTFHFTIIAGDACKSDLMDEDVPDKPKHRYADRADVEKRLLLVEDNPVNQKVATLMFQNLGFSVDVAQDGLEAVDAFEQSNYEVIFMDVHMPNMDGYQATQEIRQLTKSGEHPYIIAMTASVFESDRQDALDAGMNDFLSKPVQLDDLASLLDRLPLSEPQPV